MGVSSVGDLPAAEHTPDHGACDELALRERSGVQVPTELGDICARHADKRGRANTPIAPQRLGERGAAQWPLPGRKGPTRFEMRP